MRLVLSALPILLVAAPATAAVRDFPVGSFHRISHGASPDAIVTVGGTAASVRAEGDAEAIARLRIAVEGGELRIRPRPGRHSGGRRGPVTIRINVPALDGASLSGSGNMRIDRIESAAFDGSVDGSGNLEIGTVRAERARLAVSGSGGLRAGGSVGALILAVSGSGNAELDGLSTRDARVSVSGSGNAELRSAETADVAVSGSGNATVGGTPRCRVRSSGSGTVRCG